jgi:hypothetical protein
MKLGEIDLPLLKQQIKYLTGLSDIKADFFWFLFTKGVGYCLLNFDSLCKPYHVVIIF